MSLSQITIKNRAKNIAWIFIPVIFLAIFFAPKITNAQSTSCSKWPRDISCYKTLWGTKFDWTRDQIKTANGNGIIYLGPVKESLDSDGLPKKLLTTISLSVDNDKFRALNMIGSTYVKDDLINVRYKFYLRYLEDAFIVRIYQEDSSGKQVNVSLSPVAVSPFPDVKDSIRGSIYMPNGKSVANTLNEGKAVDRLIRFRSGSGAFSNISNIYEDGYTQNSTDSSLSNPVYTGAAGAAIGSVVPGIGTVIGGVVGAVVGALNTSGPTLVLRQTALITIELESGVKLDKNLPTYMELWYAGEDREDTSDTDVRPAGHELNQIPLENLNTPEEGDTNDPRIRYFKKSWIDYKELPYFQIGPRQTIDLPKNLADAETQANNAIAESGDVNSNLGTNATQSTLPECSIDPISNGSVMGCVAQIVYHGVFRPIAAFAQLMGYIFDFFIGYSLSDESYRHDFIQTGWQLVRDISNIFFIIIMIYSGLAAVFSTSNTSYKKVIPALIVNALIINFSLFATRIVIDMSNITARIFYNQMIVKIDGKEQSGEDSTTGYKPISEAIVSSFNPQSIFKNKVLTEEEPLQKDGSSNSSTSGVVFNGSSDPIEGKKFRVTSSEYAGYFTLVTLAAIAISFFMAMMFWKTAFMFVGRVIGLYVAMIFSPFAFLSRGNIPLVNKVGSLSFSSWWGNLSKYALLAPIFVFFLYIINAFLNVEFFTKIGLDQQTSGLTGTSSFFVSVMYVVIPMLIIYGLVSRGVKIAEDLAGDYAKMAQKFATGAAGVVGGAALGVATGGLAFAGTRGAGLLRLSEAKRASLAEARSRGGINGRIASLRLGLNDKAQSGSFDLRKTKAFSGINNLTSKMGVKLDDKISGAIGLGSDATKGGMKAIEKKEKEALKKKIESIKTDMKDSEVAEFWEKKSKALVEKEKQKILKMSEEDLVNMYKTYGKSDAEIEAMKTAGTLKNGIDDLSKKKVASDYGNVTNNKQLTQALRLQFAETIAEGKTLGQSTATKVAKGLGILDAGALLGPNILLGAASTPISAAALMTGVYDSKRSGKLEKEEAKSYAKKAREAMNNKNKLPKEERLENQKKEIEKDLESIDATLKKIFEAEIAGNPIHSGKTAQDFFDNPDIASEAIKKARKKMRDEMSTLDIDIELFKEQHRNASVAEAKARAEGKTSEADEFLRQAKEARDKMVAKNIEKSEVFQEHKDTDPEYKQKKQADLNKKDDELEKIKEKDKKDNEKKPDEKK